MTLSFKKSLTFQDVTSMKDSYYIFNHKDSVFETHYCKVCSFIGILRVSQRHLKLALEDGGEV